MTLAVTASKPRPVSGWSGVGGVTHTGHQSHPRPAEASEVRAARHAYELSGIGVAHESPRPPSNVFPLLVLVIGLAVATIWFVGLPALDRPARVQRACEVFVLESGSTRCVPTSTPRSRAVPHEAVRSRRAKH